jgi:hypothetical protein
LTVVGVKGTNPTLSQRLLLGEAGKSLPPVARVEDHSVRVCGPGDLRTEFDGIAIVVLAVDEGLFCLLAASDIDDADGDSDDLVYFVAGRLVRDEDGAGHTRPMRVGIAHFKAGVGYTVERTEEVGLALRKFLRDDFGDVAAKVGGDGKVVHLCEALVDTHVAQVAIEITESDRDAVIDRIELGESLGGESLEAQRESGSRGGRVGFRGTG